MNRAAKTAANTARVQIVLGSWALVAAFLALPVIIQYLDGLLWTLGN